MTQNRIASRWHEKGGYRDLLIMAFPLILSTGASSILHFIDRMFLTWYSPTSIAAAMPAGILNFAFMSIFIGTAGYVNTFVAQYHGAALPRRIGPSLWQGLYVSAIGGVMLFALSFASEPIFDFVAHDIAIRREEIVYFDILSKGAFFPIAASALSGYFSGRGENWPIMWINLFMTVVNIVLDYLFIFGKMGLPEMGIAGAAYATVIAGAASCMLYAVLIFRRKNDALHHSRRGWRPDGELFKRLLRYGIPSGVQFFIDVSGFSVFILLVGRIGADELAATSITFNINSLAFMPMIGFGVAISVLVGQFQGEGRPESARRSVFSGAHLCFLYMTLIAASYVFIPQVYISAFAAKADPAQFEAIRRFITVMLRFVALYTIFDTLNIVFASALKGAGDTKFVMVMILCLSVFGLTIPSYLVISVFDAGIIGAWYLVSGYVIFLGFGFLLRFLTGKWKSMKVIESSEAPIPLGYPEVPSIES